MSLSSSVLCLFLFFFAVSTAQGITFTLTLRDNEKICSTWVYIGNGGFSYSYYNHRECTSAMSLEQRNGEARLCCTGLPVTTPSTNFPKECGKQKYQPLKQRIIGGSHATANSWVSQA